MYLLNMYIIKISKIKLNITSFIKKNGTNCGICYFFYLLIQSFKYFYLYLDI